MRRTGNEVHVGKRHKRRNRKSHVQHLRGMAIRRPASGRRSVTVHRGAGWGIVCGVMKRTCRAVLADGCTRSTMAGVPGAPRMGDDRSALQGRLASPDSYSSATLRALVCAPFSPGINSEASRVRHWAPAWARVFFAVAGSWGRSRAGLVWGKASPLGVRANAWGECRLLRWAEAV
jgi:hypothetical protein